MESVEEAEDELVAAGNQIVSGGFDRSVVNDLTMGGLLSEETERMIQGWSRGYSNFTEDAAEAISWGNPATWSERVLIDAVDTLGVDLDGLEWNVGVPLTDASLNLDVVKNGEGPVERLSEGAIKGALQLGNLPAYATLAETGIEIGTNLPGQIMAGNGVGVASSGWELGERMIHGLVTEATNNPFDFTGQMVGEILAGKGLGKVASGASRLGRTSRTGSGGPDVDAPDGGVPASERVPDSGQRPSGDGPRPTDGGSESAPRLDEVTEQTDVDVDPSNLDRPEQNAVEQQLTRVFSRPTPDRVTNIVRSAVGNTDITQISVRETFSNGAQAVSNLLYPDDTAEFLRQAGVDVDQWKRLASPDDAAQRGEILEETIVPSILDNSDRFERIRFRNNEAAGDQGIDHLAWDRETNEIVVMESKYSSNDKSAGFSNLGDGYGDVQMGTDWIYEAWRKNVKNNPDAGIEYSQELRDEVIAAADDDLIEAIKATNGDIDSVADIQVEHVLDAMFRTATQPDGNIRYRRELNYAHPSRSGDTVSRKSSGRAATEGDDYMGDIFDRIQILKLHEVNNGK